MENLADAAGWIAGRAAMGQTRRLADRVVLAALVPHLELASARYCLADPGRVYVVYLPEGGEVTEDLSAAPARFTVEWIHAVEGTSRLAGEVAGGSQRSIIAPFSGDAVLYLHQCPAEDPTRCKPGSPF